MDNQEKNNSSEKIYTNVALPEKLAEKSDRIFIHQEKERKEPELSNNIE
ncbi:MAG: hypothetical protein IJ292_05100 [Clostridia bacterium]|nr:hypothetical protein [Clostridia bacterium]